MANLTTSYNVLQVKNDLASVLKGTTINQISNINNLFNRTARQFILDCDPQETIRIAQTPTIYDSVFDYSISNLSDLKGNGIIDIRPQASRSTRDVFHQTYSQEFDVNKQYTVVPNFNVDFNTATKSLRIDATQLITGILLNNADGVTGNGTWVAGTNVSNLTQDVINFTGLTASSLKFDIGASGSTAYVRNTTMTSVDLSKHDNQSTLFWYVYLPTASHFTNTYLKWGSDTSNYWTLTLTTNWQGQAFNNGWNLVGAAWNTATKTGSPVDTAVDYVEIGFTYDGTAQTGTHINPIYSRLGMIFEILYYSKFMFRDGTTQVFKETVTADSDLINLDTESIPVFFNLLAFYTVQQVSGVDAVADTNFYWAEYQKGLTRLETIYKSQKSKPKLNYYKMPKKAMSQWLGRGYWGP